MDAKFCAWCNRAQSESMFEVLIYGAMAVIVAGGLVYANWALSREVAIEAEEIDDDDWL